MVLLVYVLLVHYDGQVISLTRTWFCGSRVTTERDVQVPRFDASLIILLLCWNTERMFESIRSTTWQCQRSLEDMTRCITKRQPYDEGAILSCSGDSPFQLRMLKGVSSDVSRHYKMRLYVPDPMCVSAFDRAGSKQQTQTDSIAYKNELEGSDPHIYSRSCHRSKDRIEHRSQQGNAKGVPFVFEINVQYLPGCSSHDCSFGREWPQVDTLLLLKDANAISRLECIITDRDVKTPQFKFEVVDKLCKPVPLSFRDAEVILSDCTRTSE